MVPGALVGTGARAPATKCLMGFNKVAKEGVNLQALVEVECKVGAFEQG
jgi:hypothetical protein